jgi:carbamoyltransferase
MYWGLSYGHHDAAAVVIRDNEVVYAERAQHCTGIPGDPDIHPQMIKEMRRFGTPDQIYLHENKKRDLWRKIKTGDWTRWFINHPELPKKPISGSHHLSHAAAAYYTSGFDDALIVVADAIGELETLKVYVAEQGKIRDCIFQLDYPHSLGLFYSYHTALVGMIPNQEERILMAISRRGKNKSVQSVLDTIDIELPHFHTKINMHKRPEMQRLTYQEKCDIAATTQDVLERYFVDLFTKYKRYSSNFIFSGGVAYNSLVHEKLKPLCDKLYVPSHPGDAGSAYGAVLQHTQMPIKLPRGKMFNEKK